MPDTGFVNLFVVALVAFLAPIGVAMLPGLRIPSVVVEILAGVALGPSVLGLVEADLAVQVLAVVGLAFLLFMVGLELDVRRLRGRVLRLAAAGYAVTLVLGVAAGLGAASLGWVDSPLLLAIALSATSLGLVVPVLKDAHQADTAMGRATVAAATLADVAAVLLLTLLFSSGTSNVGARIVLLLSFFGVVTLTAGGVLFTERWQRLTDVVVRLQDTTAEIRVRAAVVLLVAFVGYGFLVPVFFVSSGIRLYVAGLLGDPAALLITPMFVLALLVVRGVPALLLRHELTRRETAAAGLLQATSLPFLVTTAMIGGDTGLLSGVTAASLVAAGIVSVLVFPATALTLLRPRGRDTVSPGPRVLPA